MAHACTGEVAGGTPAQEPWQVLSPVQVPMQVPMQALSLMPAPVPWQVLSPRPVPAPAWFALLLAGALCAALAPPASAAAGDSAATAAVASTPPGPEPAGAGPALQVQGQTLVLLDQAGQPRQRWPLRDRDGLPVQLAAQAWHARRQSLVVALAGAPELWLISLDPAAAPVFNGWVHDWRMVEGRAEGVAEPGFMGRQRVRLAQPYTALWADARVPWVLGQTAAGAAAQAVVLHLDIRREIAWLPLPGLLSAAQLRPAAQGTDWQLLLPGPAGDGGWRVDTRRWQAVRVSD